MPTIRPSPATAAALALAAAALAGTACDGARAALRPFHALTNAPYHGVAYDPPGAAPALHLATAAGGAFDLARATADSGRAALVFFGYTHCPDVCPTTLADWARVKRLLGADAARVRFVFVTVDPERDSAAAVARYVAQFDPAFVGLAPSRAALDAAERAWGVASYREEPAAGGGGAGYTVAHPAQVFAVDPAGRLRLFYGLGARPADVADDLRRLLD